MNKEYQWSDAWLLLAIIYASRSSTASLRDIVSAGDYINHAIFTFEELSNGLQRLMAGGLVRKQDESFAATDVTMEAYRRTTTSRRTALKELTDVNEFLKTRGKLFSEKSRTDCYCANLAREFYDNALKDYKDG